MPPLTPDLDPESKMKEEGKTAPKLKEEVEGRCWRWGEGRLPRRLVSCPPRSDARERDRGGREVEGS